MSSVTAETAERLGQSRALRVLARSGYAANGVLHILIGLIAAGVVTRVGIAGRADQTGALVALSSTPAGAVLLWAATITLFALAVWHLTAALTVAPHGRLRLWAERADFLGKVVAYAAMGVTSASFALGDVSDAGLELRRFTRDLITTPGGTLVLLILGAAVMAIGAFFVAKGVTGRFRQDIDVPDGTPGRVVVALGTLGYVSKGVALVIVGMLFVGAAITSNASRASGLDGALRSLARLPFGAVLLSVVALGFVAIGIYYIVRARRAHLA